jgi:hypothetical protein
VHVDENENKLLEHLVEAVRATDPAERDRQLRGAEDILRARKIILQMPKPPRAVWWQSDWFWRTVYLMVGALLSYILGVQFKP